MKTRIFFIGLITTIFFSSANAQWNWPEDREKAEEKNALYTDNFKQGNYDKALEYMAELNQDDVYNKYWMAKANHKAGNKDKAMALFQEIADDNFNSTGYALVRSEVKEILEKG